MRILKSNSMWIFTSGEADPLHLKEGDRRTLGELTKRFEISYRDQETGEEITIEKEFNDGLEISALDYAIDFAYTILDKTEFSVREVKNKVERG